MNLAWKRRFHRPGKVLGSFCVVDVRFGIHLGVDDANQPSLFDKAADLARGVIEIAEYPGSGGADHHAGRFQTALQAVLAKVALIGNMPEGMAEAGAVGTGWDAITTVDTDGGVYEHQAVLGFKSGSGYRAGGYTGRFIALHTIAGLKVQLAAGFICRLYPISIRVRRDVVLQLAGNDTGLTVKTSGDIYHHTIFGLHIDALIFSVTGKEGSKKDFSPPVSLREFVLLRGNEATTCLLSTMRKLLRLGLLFTFHLRRGFLLNFPLHSKVKRQFAESAADLDGVSGIAQRAEIEEIGLANKALGIIALFDQVAEVYPCRCQGFEVDIWSSLMAAPTRHPLGKG